LFDTTIPLPSSRNPLPAGPLQDVITAVLEPLGLKWADMRIKHQQDVFFSKGSRPCLVVPQNVEFKAVRDELHPGRHGLALSFELGKGSYATILVKQITSGSDRER
jgi:tRNA pseudouridine13 synthase